MSKHDFYYWGLTVVFWSFGSFRVGDSWCKTKPNDFFSKSHYNCTATDWHFDGKSQDYSHWDYELEIPEKNLSAYFALLGILKFRYEKFEKKR